MYVQDGTGVWSQQAYVKASNTDASDAFGGSVALYGDTLAVGASGEDSAATGIDGDQGNNNRGGSGAVYVFTRDAAGVWSQQAYIKASNAGRDDQFGGSVALFGDTLAVGVPLEDSAATGIDGDQRSNDSNEAGAVYVFTRDEAGTWSQQAYIKASNTDARDYFGYSVALSGDTLVVGAPLEDSAATGINGDESDDSASSAGAAYVFARDGAGVWSQQAYIKASSTDTFGQEFGRSVAISGDTLAIGASDEDGASPGVNGDQDDNNAEDSGAVYVFTQDGAGVWSQQAYIKASNPTGYDYFGASVALSGDTLAVGAHGEDSLATGIDGDQGDFRGPSWAEFYSTGAAYVFTRDGVGVWSQQAYIKASNTEENDRFGCLVALSGDTLTVGARSEASAATGIDGDESDNSAQSAGAGYVFTRDGAGVWSQQAYIKASNTDAGDLFGCSITLSEDTLAVGAPSEDSAAIGIDGNQGNSVAHPVVPVSVVVGMPTRGAVNPHRVDMMPVTVLGSADFDATQVDASSIQFGPRNASPVLAGHVVDINNDHIVDMLFYFNAQDSGIVCGDIEAPLSGATFGGDAIAGSASVRAAGCR